LREVELRYSEAFKQQVVSELEEGRFGSPYEASQAYGIRGHATVRRWVQQYGKGHLLNKVVRVEKQGEAGEIKRLKERVRQLESALADAYIDGALAESYFEILCERTKTDAEAFKKNTLGQCAPSAGEGRRGESGRRRAALCASGDKPSELLQDEESEAEEIRR